MLKENGSEYSLLEKIYNALFYSVLFYIHQLHMLSRVKYRNSIFKRIAKNLKIIQAPQCQKKNCSEYNLSEKIYNSLFYSVLSYIQKIHMLSHLKYRNSIFKRIKKNLNIIQALQGKTKNFSEGNMSEKIYNAFLYSVLEYIHTLSMLSHVKYRNFNFT